uniref:Uncharacterized protein n=1 Tax=Anguilla anguilla TaxID=7936 RepID=A0A0E9P564_ANGAN
MHLRISCGFFLTTSRGAVTRVEVYKPVYKPRRRGGSKTLSDLKS